MDIIYLQTFREAALRQSFTRAAEELGYAQSSVTAQIQKLEKAYGVKLFERHNGRMRLTSAGEELFKIAGQIVELYEQSKEKLAKQGGGTLTIATIDSLASYFLPAYIQSLRQQYPELGIRLLTDSEERVIQQVKEGEADIGLLMALEPSEPALKWMTVKDEPLVLIANPGNRLTAEEAIRLDQLSDAEWIVPEATCNYRMMLEKTLRSNNISYRIGLELGNPEAIKRSVKAGSGISLLPLMAAQEEIARGEVAVLPFSHPDIRLNICFLMHPNKWVSHALASFTGMLLSGGNE